MTAPRQPRRNERPEGGDDLATDQHRAASQDLRQAVQVLHLQQIELARQNEELAKSQYRLEQSRAALAASENRYRELFDSTPVGNLQLDEAGAIAEANRAAAQILGAQSGELVGRKLSDFVAARDQDAYHLHRHAAADGATPVPAHLTLRALDGQMRDVELGARPIACDRRELCVAILDVSARERAQAGQDQSERQRRLMADALPVAVSYVAADGRYEFCNRAFEKLFGRSAEQIEGRPIFEILDPETYAALREHLRTALAGETARFEGRLFFPASGLRFVSALLAPDRGPDGAVRGFCALIDDRTELDEARHSLRRAAAQAALAEERERRALAADLHDDVGQLVSLLSIKLRELDAQLGDSAQDELVRDADVLTREIRSKISTLTFELSPPLLYDVGFVAAAEWLADSLRERFGLRTSIETRGELPVLDEPTRVTLFRALRELLVNVAKHAGTNRARVKLAGGAQEISVTVEDDGCGFDPQTAANGFGLGNTADRIESLGGRISIDSTRRRGSTVSLCVPAVQRSWR
jgi:PAS domain S-box-containing protein